MAVDSGSVILPVKIMDDTADDSARKALSASLGAIASDDDLIGRTEERAAVEAFLEDCFVTHQSGSLYISGGAGTGKTCCVQSLSKKWTKRLPGLKVVNVNCMSLPNRSVNVVLGSFLAELGVKGGAKGATAKQKEDALCNSIKSRLQKDQTPVLFVVDEADQLVVGQRMGQDNLYSVLGLAKRLSSKKIPVAVIAIANAVDLLTRSSKSGQQAQMIDCKSLLFAPYTAAQLREIAAKRLSSLSQAFIDPVKLQLSCMRTAKLSGDCRKALALCQQALQESSEQKSPSGLAPTRSLRRDNSDPCNIVAQLPLEQQIILIAFVVKNNGGALKAAEVRKRYGDHAKSLGVGGTPPGKAQIIEMMGTMQQRGVLKVISKKGAEPQGELTMPIDAVKDILEANPALRSAIKGS